MEIWVTVARSDEYLRKPTTPNGVEHTIELMDQRNGLDERKIEVMEAIKDRLVEIRDAITAK